MRPKHVVIVAILGFLCMGNYVPAGFLSAFGCSAPAASSSAPGEIWVDGQMLEYSDGNTTWVTVDGEVTIPGATLEVNGVPVYIPPDRGGPTCEGCTGLDWQNDGWSNAGARAWTPYQSRENPNCTPHRIRVGKKIDAPGAYQWGVIYGCWPIPERELYVCEEVIEQIGDFFSVTWICDDKDGIDSSLCDWEKRAGEADLCWMHQSQFFQSEES